MDRILSLIPKVYFPKEIYFGERSTAYFKVVADKKKIFVVSRSARKQYEQQLTEWGFDDNNAYVLSGEPTEADLNKVIDLLRESQSALVIAFGGGSVLDLAKLAKRELELPMIAMPTTIGSGAEVSQHALINLPDGKKVVSHADLLPEVVLVNSSFLISLDDTVIKIQSMDALGHAFESLVSRMSHSFSDTLAVMALDKLYEGLMTFTDNTTRSESLETIQNGAMLAGIAQSSAATGLAHAYAHCIGPKMSISHAQAVSLFLIDTIEYNRSKSDVYKKLSMTRNFTEENVVDKLRELYTRLGIEDVKLKGIADPDELAQRIQRDICTLSNPVRPSVEDIKEILSNKL